MSDKIVEDGQVANGAEHVGENGDPSITDRSYLIPESEDEFYSVKKKWKWKPTRLILLWFIMESFQVLYMFLVSLVLTCLALKINIGEVDFIRLFSIVVFVRLFKTWWNK